MARAIRCIQLDAVGVAGAPTQLLVPFSRQGPYDRSLLDRLLFKDRSLFHYFAHAASLVLTEDFAIHSARMRSHRDWQGEWGQRVAAWIEENLDLRRQVLDEIERRGPLRSRDFVNNARTDWRSSGWTEGRSVNRMLEFLWSEGALTVAGRSGSERLWELSSRWFPDSAPREQLGEEERSDRAVRFALLALGVATAAQVRVHFLRGAYPDLPGSLARLARAGEVRAVTVRGLRGEWFVHRDSLPLLEAPWRPRTVLLSPFDNLIADRRRTAELFAFEYTIEIYVPAARRRRGYYAMPILAGDRLIGTVDPRLDRASKTLLINAVVLEPGERMTDRVRSAVAELARFVGAEAVVYR